MTKRYWKHIFCSTSNADRNKTGLGFEPSAHCQGQHTTRSATILGIREYDFDQITSLTETTNDGSPHHEDSN
jgi:hypothetical protein